MSSREESYLDRFSAQRGVRRSRGNRKPTIEDLKRDLAEATMLQRTTPDLALNLEIADTVNALKGDAPKVVCKFVSKIVSSSFGHPSTSMIALSILDVCVKNCGYPFHLQISRKEFLNKLVASFSYRPPSQHLNSKQLLILEMIEEWNLTLAKSAVYRDDLGNIRDMHRLLASRGYVFPEVSNSELLALSSEQNNLKSATELEQEERERQSIKMQMLLSSKNPEDLKEANRIMSILAGYQESQVDYRAKVAADLDKLRRTKELLLSAIGSGVEAGSPNDVFEELAQTLKSAVPKLERLLKGEASEEEDSEAHIRVTQLLNDIEAALAQYHSAVSGEPVNLPKARSIGGGHIPSTGASLIDIDSDESPNDDLLALGSLSLGNSTGTSSSTRTASTAADAQSGSFSLEKQSPTKSNDLLDIFGSSSAGNAPVSSATASSQLQSISASAESEIWSDESLTVTYAAEKSSNTTTLTLKFFNAGIKKITGLETQLAQPRSLTMDLGSLSRTQLEPKQDSIQKVILKGESAPKLRWRANYSYGLDKRTANGDIKTVN